MERRRQTRGNCLCSAALSGAASELGPLGISVGMPNITLIPRQQNSPKHLFGGFFFVCLFVQELPGSPRTAGGVRRPESYQEATQQGGGFRLWEVCVGRREALRLQLFMRSRALVFQ